MRINRHKINETLQIAGLAGFAKSCGLINQAQLDDIVSIHTSNLNKNKYLSTFNPPNSDLYKKAGVETFRDSIINAIYAKFFHLMQTNAAFALNMANIMYNVGKNKLSSEALRDIILQKTSDAILNIIERIKKGETFTEEQIAKIIEKEILAKQNEIKQEAENVTKGAVTTPEGISGNTKFSKLAIKQRYRGIKWRPIKGGTLSPKSIERVQKTTKNIKKQLDKIKSSLRSARSVVSLLRKLESVYSNGLIGILKSLSKIIFSYFRDIGSTGVYVLDMTEPYLTNRLLMSIQNLRKKDKKYQGYTPEQIENIKLLERLNRDNIASTNDYLNYDITNATPFLSDLLPEEKTNVSQNLDDWTKDIIGIYKPTTYIEFITTIANAFQDQGDRPGWGLEWFNNKGDLKINKQLNDPKTMTKRSKSIIEIMTNTTNRFSRPGRPVFEPGSNVNVIIVAFNMPDVFKLGAIGLKTLSAFIQLIMFLTPGTGSSLYKNNIFEWGKFSFDDSKFGKRWNRFWKKVAKSKPYDYLKEKPYLNEYGQLEMPTDISENPDFYGIAVRNLFPYFFSLVDQMESEIEKYTKNFKSSLAKELDNLLDNIEELIDDLEDFINIIDDIIDFFNTLKEMGLYTLQITSNGGNNDIIQKLMNAQGFPQAENGDPLRLIGGVVFCYGFPNLKPGNIDFIGMVKEKMAIINYEAALTKYESSGDSKDDPGSIFDYLRDQNIGPTYNSQLDKIFKKLF